MKSPALEACLHNHPAIATVINFCTDDRKFLDACLAQVAIFSNMIIVPVCDHFYNGDRENMSLLGRIIKKHSSELIRFVVFNYDHSKTAVYGSQYWINYARWTGFKHLGEDVEYVLLLDADEIIEGEKFLQWMDTSSFFRYDTVSFNVNWYFREPVYQATKTEESGFLVRKALIRDNLFFTKYDRRAFLTLPAVLRMQNGPDGNPMVHHYSWVRSKEEMVRKVQSWGHNKDRNWLPLVEKEFEHEFDGTDFVHGYQYITVDCPFTFGDIYNESEEDTPLRRDDDRVQDKEDNYSPCTCKAGTAEGGNIAALNCQAEAVATLIRLGDISAAQHLFERARELYNKALRIAPSNAEVLSRLDNLNRLCGLPDDLR